MVYTVYGIASFAKLRQKEGHLLWLYLSPTDLSLLFLINMNTKHISPKAEMQPLSHSFFNHSLLKRIQETM